MLANEKFTNSMKPEILEKARVYLALCYLRSGGNTQANKIYSNWGNLEAKQFSSRENLSIALQLAANFTSITNKLNPVTRTGKLSDQAQATEKNLTIVCQTAIIGKIFDHLLAAANDHGFCRKEILWLPKLADEKELPKKVQENRNRFESAEIFCIQWQ